MATTTLLKIRDLTAMLSISRRYIYALVARGTFPKPTKDGNKLAWGKPRIAWRSEDIYNWVDNLKPAKTPIRYRTKASPPTPRKYCPKASGVVNLGSRIPDIERDDLFDEATDIAGIVLCNGVLELHPDAWGDHRQTSLNETNRPPRIRPKPEPPYVPPPAPEPVVDPAAFENWRIEYSKNYSARHGARSWVMHNQHRWMKLRHEPWHAWRSNDLIAMIPSSVDPNEETKLKWIRD